MTAFLYQRSLIIPGEYRSAASNGSRVVRLFDHLDRPRADPVVGAVTERVRGIGFHPHLRQVEPGALLLDADAQPDRALYRVPSSQRRQEREAADGNHPLELRAQLREPTTAKQAVVRQARVSL